MFLKSNTHVPLVVNDGGRDDDRATLLLELVDRHASQRRRDLPERTIHLITVLGRHQERSHTVLVGKFGVLHISHRREMLQIV